MSARDSLLRTLAAAAVVLLGACDSTAPDPVPTPDPEPRFFTLTPNIATIEEGQTLELTAIVTDQNGNRLAVSNIEWTSSDQNVVRLLGPGKVEGEGAGTAVIGATWQGFTDQAVVKVLAAPSCPPLLRASESAAPCPAP